MEFQHPTVSGALLLSVVLCFSACTTGSQTSGTPSLVAQPSLVVGINSDAWLDAIPPSTQRGFTLIPDPGEENSSLFTALHAVVSSRLETIGLFPATLGEASWIIRLRFLEAPPLTVPMAVERGRWVPKEVDTMEITEFIGVRSDGTPITRTVERPVPVETGSGEFEGRVEIVEVTMHTHLLRLEVLDAEGVLVGRSLISGLTPSQDKPRVFSEAITLAAPHLGQNTNGWLRLQN